MHRLLTESGNLITLFMHDIATYLYDSTCFRLNGYYSAVLLVKCTRVASRIEYGSLFSILYTYVVAVGNGIR